MAMHKTRFRHKYELIVWRNRRWQSDGFVDDKQTAQEEARAIIARDPLVTAVRVVMLDEEGSGISERPVCLVTAASVNGGAGAPAKRSATVVPLKAQPKPQSRKPVSRSWSRREKALAWGVVIAAVGMLSYGIMKPKQQWAFDLPDAQKPHMLRNSFTGEFDHGQ